MHKTLTIAYAKFVGVVQLTPKSLKNCKTDVRFVTTGLHCMFNAKHVAVHDAPGAPRKYESHGARYGGYPSRQLPT